MPPSCLLLQRRDGLGGRIKTMIFAINLANQWNIPLLILWARDTRYPCPTFNQIFNDIYYDYLNLPLRSRGIYIDKRITKKNIKSLLDHVDEIHLQSKMENPITRPLDLQKFIEMLQNPELICDECTSPNAQNADLVYVNKVKFKVSQPIEVFKFKPSPAEMIHFHSDLTQQVHDFQNKHQITGYIGLHVRRGDLLGNARLLDNPPQTSAEIKEALLSKKYSMNGRLVGIDRYMECIDQYDKTITKDEKLPIILCTDDDKIIPPFVEKYGRDRIFYFPQEEYDDRHMNAILGAIYDLILLSEAEGLITDLYTNFSHIAKQLGQITTVLLAKNN